MHEQEHRGAKGYVVTNADGRWLSIATGSGASESYRWADTIREAHVFDSRWAARLACFTMGGYIVELTRN